MQFLEERIDFLVAHRPVLEKWVGPYDEAALKRWLDAELGDWRRLERWIDGSRVVPRGPVLHVVSGNTEHAAFQSVFRAILVGSESRVKIPSAGLREFERWAADLDFLNVSRELPEAWRESEVAAVYGGADTLRFFRKWLSDETRFIPHGPKLSAAFVFHDREGLARKLADDIMRYGQRGCLSVQAVYYDGDPAGFCERLAGRLRDWTAGRARAESTLPELPEAGAIRNERELARFRIANGAPMTLWESPNSVDWTVLLDQGGTILRGGPGGGFVRVMRMPETISRETLGKETDFLSTAVVEPISSESRLEKLGPPRICAPGLAQEPGIFWHPDGEMPLAGLVRWRDLG